MTARSLLARSEAPFSVQDGFDRAGFNDPAGQPGERPNMVSGRSTNPILGHVDQWFDPSAFALQGPGFLGNLGRNTLVGPKFFDLDLALAKNTRIKETMNVEYHAEAFNILNHPNFGLPVGALFSAIDQNGNGIRNPTARQIINTVGTARQLQLALKFRFQSA